ncbi:hypothetical protein ABE28_018545 [Peribacillus muralis]|uniref:Uncharacterized protein n=1 Tax=Peribacillus muralis TaxID=264697 RepID=A0A1B3XT27_9BACI|nr:hypothetical protein [Peribacillus muralis]AOH56370.1 hypothetical protein ABE28_018545 [Peribacillus muralis]
MLIEHLCNAMILFKMIMEVLPKEQTGALAEDRSCFLTSTLVVGKWLGSAVQPCFRPADTTDLYVSCIVTIKSLGSDPIFYCLILE